MTRIVPRALGPDCWTSGVMTLVAFVLVLVGSAGGGGERERERERGGGRDRRERGREREGWMEGDSHNHQIGETTFEGGGVSLGRQSVLGPWLM